MDIFGKDKENRLLKYKSASLYFSPMENSTSTVEGILSNVSHNEEELMEFLECEEDIVKIDSNFGHLILEGYSNAPKERKSNRGRKKKPKPIKTRKLQGDGSGFNSQISFTVLGEVIRPEPLTKDKHSEKASLIEMGNPSKKYEKFIKEYKIKIFRNGKFTIPGVLTEDLTDVKSPLLKLCNYFSRMFLEDVEIINLFSVMRNYKFYITDGKVDIKKLYKYCVDHFQNLLNTRFEDIEEFIINPGFENIKYSPNTIGWGEFLYECYDDSDLVMKLSMHEFKNSLKESKNNKNLFIDFNKLKIKISEMPLKSTFQKIKDFVKIIQEAYFINLNNQIIKNIIKYMLKDDFKLLEKFLKKSKDNLLSHIKWDSEKYPGFLIKVKTPNSTNPNKRTTIKIFPSGKINIDGANNRSEADFIYYWLNYLFYEHSEFIYDSSHQNYDDSDSEFSSDSDDDR
jgi:hypothetical protein